MQIGDWGNVLIRHVCERKHRKYSLWACPFFRGLISWRFSLSKNNTSPTAPDLELVLFPLWYWPIMNTNTKQQQDKVFQTDFIDSQTSNPPSAHLLALSHMVNTEKRKEKQEVQLLNYQQIPLPCLRNQTKARQKLNANNREKSKSRKVNRNLAGLCNNE